MRLAYSFPSSHAALAMLSFGLLAVVAGHAMGRWSKALIYSLAGMVIFLIGFSRLYLGVHWLGDVLAGIAALCRDHHRLWRDAGSMARPPHSPARHDRRRADSLAACRRTSIST